MTHDELRPDGYGLYKAYYQGRLVQITDPNIPTVLDECAIQRTVAWGELTAQPQPKIVIHKFSVAPSSAMEGAEVTVEWNVDNAAEMWVKVGGNYHQYTCPSAIGSMCVLVPNPRDYYNLTSTDKYTLTLTLTAIGDGGKETATSDIIVYPKPKPEPKTKSKPRTEPVSSIPHVCPDHPTVEDATYHATQIENEIKLFLSELRQQSKENTSK